MIKKECITCKKDFEIDERYAQNRQCKNCYKGLTNKPQTICVSPDQKARLLSNILATIYDPDPGKDLTDLMTRARIIYSESLEILKEIK